MPRATLPPGSGPDPLRVLRTKTQTPLPDRLVGDINAVTHQHPFHNTEAEVEPVIQLDGVADNLARIAVTVIQGGGSHGFRLPPSRQLDSTYFTAN